MGVNVDGIDARSGCCGGVDGPARDDERLCNGAWLRSVYDNPRRRLEGNDDGTDSIE